MQNAFSRILYTSRHVSHAKFTVQSWRSWNPCEMDLFHNCSPHGGKSEVCENKPGVNQGIMWYISTSCILSNDQHQLCKQNLARRKMNVHHCARMAVDITLWPPLGHYRLSLTQERARNMAALIIEVSQRVRNNRSTVSEDRLLNLDWTVELWLFKLVCSFLEVSPICNSIRRFD